MQETAANASKTVCSCDIKENEMWDPGAGHFARCRNGHQKMKNKERQKCKASFAIRNLKHVQDYLMRVIMADEKLQKIQCHLYNWLLHENADSCMTYYFSIPTKMRRKSEGVACAVACQMLVH